METSFNPLNFSFLLLTLSTNKDLRDKVIPCPHEKFSRCEEMSQISDECIQSFPGNSYPNWKWG